MGLVKGRGMKLEMVCVRRLAADQSRNQAVATLEDFLVSGLALSTDHQKEFLKSGWQVQFPTACQGDGHESVEFYFHHYNQFRSNAASVLRSYTDKHVCDAMQQLTMGEREECELAISQTLPAALSTAHVTKLVEFIGRAVLLLELKDWKFTETLEDFVCWTVASKSAQKDDFRLPRSFNARTFAKVAGINTQRTRNLSEHLKVKGNDSDIAMFHYVTVLNLYQQSALGQIFPTGFLAETKRTLSLMILTSADGPSRS